MRNTRDSSNTRPMDWLIARAESSEWPSGFSSTMRACGRRGRRWRGSARSARTGSARSPGSAPAPGLAALQVPRETAEVGALRGVHGQVVEARGEAFPLFGGELAARHHRADVALGEGEEGGVVQRAAGEGEDPRIGRQAVLTVQAIERRQQLAGPGRRYRRRPGCRRTLEWLVYSRQAPDGVGWAWLTVCSITTRLLQRIEPSL